MLQELNLRIKIDRDFNSFNDFEIFLIERIREIILERIKVYVAELDREVCGRFKARHPEYVNHGKAKRKLRCCFGEVWISRGRFRCRGKRDKYPLDSYLPEGGVSAFVEELAMELATEIPYGRSSRFLRKATGISWSSKGIWDRLQARGQAARARVEAQRRRIFDEGGDEYPQDAAPIEEVRKRDPYYVELDGTMVSSRAPGRARFEVKAGVMYRGVEKVGKGRRRLMGKVVHSAVEDGDVFGEQFYSVCRRHGLDLRGQVEFISDGAGWLRTIAGGQFCGARKRLDLYHLKKACLSVVSDEEWQGLEEALYSGDIEAFVDTLETIVSSKNIPQKEKAEVLDYVLSNQDSLDYGKGKRNGSGAIEKNIGIHVGRRFKRQGMSWSRKGANNLLALRTEKLNRLWNNQYGW